MESITTQKAQEYQDAFFAEELGGSFPKEQDIIKVQEGIEVGTDKYEMYQPFGVTYSAADGVLNFNGQRVKFFIDQAADESASALWTDEAGTVNLVVLRDASGQITRVDGISDEKAQEYLASANAPIIDVDRLEAEEEAADKLVRRESYNFLFVIIAVILPLEGDKAVVNVKDAVVGDGDTVGIPAQIFHDTGGIPEGRLTVDHPFLAVTGVQKLSKRLRILEIAQ